MKHLDFPGVWQIGVIVPDAKKAAEKAIKIFGVEPEYSEFGTHSGYEHCNTRYYGEPTDGSGCNYCFKLGAVEFEFITPIGDPSEKSTWRDFLNEHPKGGIHHIAWRTENTEEATKLMESEGLPKIQEGWWATGRYTYFDAIEDMGMTMELLQFFDEKEEN